jgi:hypothetical protein
VSVSLRQGYSSGGRSRITKTVTPQTMKNPTRMATPNRMKTMGMTVAGPARADLRRVLLQTLGHDNPRCRIQQRQVGERLREVPEMAACVGVELLGI